jgi:pSer/pThr/pTyr-binding forkhead associated (FHA) protein
MATNTRCARCGRENDPGLAFCLDCGQTLRAASAAAPAAGTCAACGARLEAGFRFCGGCGAPAGVTPLPAGPRTPATPRRTDTGRSPPPTPAPPRAAPAPPPRAPATGIRLSAVRTDGLPGAVFPLRAGESLCGRAEGAIRLGDDPTVSPRHARFTLHGGVLRVEDLGSVNGTFVRLRAPRRLQPGDELRVGRQLLRLEPGPRAAAAGAGPRAPGAGPAAIRLRLVQLLDGGGAGDVFPLRDGESTVGRDGPDVSFPLDRYVSGRHARLVVDGEAATLTDLGSSNGTFVRLSAALDLAPGDQLLIGAQLLRVEA